MSERDCPEIYIIIGNDAELVFAGGSEDMAGCVDIVSIHGDAILALDIPQFIGLDILDNYICSYTLTLNYSTANRACRCAMTFGVGSLACFWI